MDDASPDTPLAEHRAFHARPLDGDELAALEALKAATEGNAAQYVAIVSVLVSLKERYEVQVRTERIAAELERHGLETTNLRQHLGQLQSWGNVTWTQDTARVSSLDEFRKRRELWQLTAAGHAVHHAVVRVLGAAERAGALQRTLFREIRENLSALGEAIDAADAPAVYLRLRDLDSALNDLAENARDFHSKIAELRREQEVDPERFLAYKALLIDYLQEFLDDLVRYRVVIADQVRAVAARGVDRLARLAAEGDDSRNIFGDDDLAARWRARFDGLTAWFVAGPGGDRTGADRLTDATTGAIRSLMILLRRLTESASRPITRASEMLLLARWFQRCGTAAEAHALFDAAFGLGRPVHLGQDDTDPDRTPPSTSWWDAPPVEVPITLRRFGRHAAPGRTTPVADYSEVKRFLADEHDARRRERAEAARRLTARPLDGRVISASELDFLLELLDRAAHRRDPLSPLDTCAEAEGARLVLRTQPGSRCVVVSQRGRLAIDDVLLTVEAVDGARAGEPFPAGATAERSSA